MIIALASCCDFLLLFLFPILSSSYRTAKRGDSLS